MVNSGENHDIANIVIMDILEDISKFVSSSNNLTTILEIFKIGAKNLFVTLQLNRTPDTIPHKFNCLHILRDQKPLFPKDIQ